jgi:hypothetical protein
MRKLFLLTSLCSSMFLSVPAVHAADPVPAAERSIQERLDDIEAYINNGSRNSNTNTASKIPGAGPGQGWASATSTRRRATTGRCCAIRVCAGEDGVVADRVHRQGDGSHYLRAHSSFGLTWKKRDALLSEPGDVDRDPRTEMARPVPEG